MYCVCIHSSTCFCKYITSSGHYIMNGVICKCEFVSHVLRTEREGSDATVLQAVSALSQINKTSDKNYTCGHR